MSVGSHSGTIIKGRIYHRFTLCAYESPAHKGWKKWVCNWGVAPKRRGNPSTLGQKQVEHGVRVLPSWGCSGIRTLSSTYVDCNWAKRCWFTYQWISLVASHVFVGWLPAFRSNQGQCTPGCDSSEFRCRTLSELGPSRISALSALLVFWCSQVFPILDELSQSFCHRDYNWGITRNLSGKKR